MYDEFLRTHNEIDLYDPDARLQSGTMRAVESFLQKEVPHPGKIITTSDVKEHELFFRYILESRMARNPFFTSKIDRTLFEAIMLLRLMYLYGYRGATPVEQRSANVLKFMCVEKLVELFLGLNEADHGLIYSISHCFPDIQSHAWKRFCDQGRACARAIRLFSHIEECWLYFPTIYEKYELGIDIILMTEHENTYREWCVFVNPEQLTVPLIDLTLVHPQTDARQEKVWYARVGNGAKELTETFPPYQFRGCCITQHNHRLDITPDEVRIARDFVLSHTPSAANSNSVAA